MYLAVLTVMVRSFILNGGIVETFSKANEGHRFEFFKCAPFIVLLQFSFSINVSKEG